MPIPAGSVTKQCRACQTVYPYLETHICPLSGGAPGMEGDRLVGATIDDRYEVISMIGEGGMGAVYKARHIHLEKTVAIKVLSNAQNEEAWARFRQEAKSASMITHSNIVAITDFGVLPDHRAYLVMEYLEGQTLGKAIGGRPMGALRTCQIGVQIARGLAAVHEKGIVHRDLKPDNIFLIDREGQRDQVKIVDFGIAKVESSARLTQHGMVVGTAEYISPEQATGKEVDHRCDQYALGCILYEMITGTQPFKADTATVLMKMHVFDAPEPPHQRVPDGQVPASVEAIVLRLMAKEADQRFADMGQVEQALQQATDEMLQAPTSAVSMPSLLIAGAARPKKSLYLYAGGAAAVVIAIIMLVALSGSRPPPKSADPPVRPQAISPIKEAPPPQPAPAAKGSARVKRKGGNGKDQPLTVRFFTQRPSDSVLLTCTPDIKQVCRKTCTVVIPAGAGQCVASASGYASRPYPYSMLQGMARGKGQVRQRISLAEFR